MVKSSQEKTNDGLNENFAHLNIIKLYEKATEKVPILKYSWVLIATICILTLIGYFKLQKTEVFIYAVLVLLISFLGFVFSYIIKSATNNYIKLLLHLLITCIIAVMCVLITGFGCYLLTGRPSIFIKIFNQESKENSYIMPFTTKLHSMVYKINFNSSLCDVLSYELGPDSCEHVKYSNLSIAGECSTNDIKYYWRSINESKIKDELYPYLKSRGLISKNYLDGYVTYFFQNNKLTRLAIRIFPKNRLFEVALIKSLIENTTIKESDFITKEVDGIHYVVGCSFQDGDILEIFVSNDQGYSSCIHDWWHDLKEK